MSSRLDQIVECFAEVDDELRVELLLDYSRKLPPLPARFHAERDAGENRVPECMTPVFMWIEAENGAGHLYVDVAEEAPTVKGILSILIHAYDGAALRDLAQAPSDLVNRLGLSRILRMNRAIGVSAIIGRIKRQAAQLADQCTPGPAADGAAPRSQVHRAEVPDLDS